ncbi:alpha/beta hydrolase [Endozoicomonas lisbonensis]|uniref:Alpha/beta superfamily hydrolase n=1 Tax=Endozoicomonas lisbonensis TaxID=3120522 RepID=A0ABV2SFW6_9GAMM
MDYEQTRLKIVQNLKQSPLQRAGLVKVYLPIDYECSINTYPVLYMHDGQNLFYPGSPVSGASWQAGEQLDQLQKTGITSGVILVAIDCSVEDAGLDRMSEYSPWYAAPAVGLNHWQNQKLTRGGKGDLYTDWLTRTLKPFIDQHFRTRPGRETTLIAGSSMGAVISLYTALKYPDIFSNVGAMSPAFWFAEKPLRTFIDETDFVKSLSIYMDIGTRETSDSSLQCFPDIYLEGVRSFYQQLSRKPFTRRLCLNIDHEGMHSEKDWAKRFPDMLRWLLKSDL